MNDWIYYGNEPRKKNVSWKKNVNGLICRSRGEEEGKMKDIDEKQDIYNIIIPRVDISGNDSTHHYQATRKCHIGRRLFFDYFHGGIFTCIYQLIPRIIAKLCGQGGHGVVRRRPVSLERVRGTKSKIPIGTFHGFHSSNVSETWSYEGKWIKI